MTPIPKRHPLISPRIHQKMSKGCGNDYLEAFGKKKKKKKKKNTCFFSQKSQWGLKQPPFGGRELKSCNCFQLE